MKLTKEQHIERKVTTLPLLRRGISTTELSQFLGINLTDTGKFIGRLKEQGILIKKYGKLHTLEMKETEAEKAIRESKFNHVVNIREPTGKERGFEINADQGFCAWAIISKSGKIVYNSIGIQRGYYV
jgi:hypothetical protein